MKSSLLPKVFVAAERLAGGNRLEAESRPKQFVLSEMSDIFAGAPTHARKAEHARQSAIPYTYPKAQSV
jgi:hypothetical protein